jgi:hypothetical protein
MVLRDTATSNLMIGGLVFRDPAQAFERSRPKPGTTADRYEVSVRRGSRGN